MHAMATDILGQAKTAGCEVVLPTDAVVANELKAGVATQHRAGERGAWRRDDPRRRPGHRSPR